MKQTIISIGRQYGSGGRIIAQRAFEYLGSDPEELEARVHAVEHPLYVETVAKLVAEQ